MGTDKKYSFQLVTEYKVQQKLQEMASKVQEQLQKEIDAFQKIQKDLQKLVTGRQQLDVQYNENKVVKDELDLVEPDSNVYKLTGPILVKQDLSEAKLNLENV